MTNFAHNSAAGGYRSCYEKGAQNTCKKELTDALNNLQTCQNPAVNPSNTELNPICHLLALLEAHHILHFTRIRANKIAAVKY
jgi:hypothetical protein